MKKVILFLWFGDETPAYTQWTLENFRQMNPGWEIRYIEYSTDQVIHHELVGDPILSEVMTSRESFGYIGNVTNIYRACYLNKHDELMIYCDLDCFPIAPFDNFLVGEGKENENWFTKLHAPKHLTPAKLLGLWSLPFNTIHTIHQDSWCMCNSKICTDMFLQIHKSTQANEELIYHKGMVINKSDIPEYEKRTRSFHEMKIELGNNFCLPQFTPIEHYYSYERNKLNLNATV